MKNENGSESKPGRQESILIVEDDQGLNSLIQKTLERAGMRVESAFDAKEAISKIADNNIDMMLLDYQLPDMKGSELIAALIEKNNNVPFIIVTGHGDEKIAVEMMKLGARDYIVKDKGFMEILPFVLGKAIKEVERERRLEETEKKIIHAAEEWRVTFDAIADFVTVHDNDFRIVKANKALADFLGVRIQDIVGRHCYEILHNLSEPIADCAHIEMLKTGKTVTKEINDDHLGRYLMISVSPIFNEAGEIKGSVHYMKDITEIKRSEDELKKRVDDLEKFYEMAVNRELRMKELKKDIKMLNEELSKYRTEGHEGR
ncbi:MAG: response regulator [Thermodesulfovibrionia bacterium]|nr:response regulator [Thermodesulfovibrionia bacterium]